MKNVLIVAMTSYAGMGPYVSEIVNEFYPDDNIYFLFRDYDEQFYFKNIKKELHPKSEFVRIPNTRWNTLIDMLFNRNRLWKHIKRLCKEKEISLVHFIYNPVDVNTFKRLKRRGVDVISTVHDLRPHEAKKEWYKMLRHRISTKWISDGLNKGDNFITNSKAQLIHLEKMYPKKNIFYHPFPSLVTDIVKNGRDVPEELKDLKNPFILFFGLIEEYKGVSMLYDVFLNTPEINKQYYLVIAGRGTNTHLNNIPEKHVIFLNRYIADTEIAFLYMNAKAVVYPYISATQSGVLTLASYFGTPILASDVPFFKESIENGYNGILFHSGDENHLRKTMLELLNSDTSNLTLNEKEFYNNHYSKGLLRVELLNIYKRASSI